MQDISADQGDQWTRRTWHGEVRNLRFHQLTKIHIRQVRSWKRKPRGVLRAQFCTSDAPDHLLPDWLHLKLFDHRRVDSAHASAGVDERDPDNWRRYRLTGFLELFSQGQWYFDLNEYDWSLRDECSPEGSEALSIRRANRRDVIMNGH